MTGLREGAETAVNQCLGVGGDETVLVVTDPERRVIGRAVHEAASEVAEETVYAEMEADERHGAEPPAPVAAAMEASDVVIAPTTRSLTHTEARKGACGAGARVATMPGVTEEIVRGSMLADYPEVERAAVALTGDLEGAEEVRVTSKRGTDLLLDVRGVEWRRDTGICREPGCYTNLPAGEVYLAPGTGDGTLVVDGSMSGLGVLDEPVEIRFEAGEATHVSDPDLLELVEEAGDCGRNLAEFGIGLNPEATLVGNVLQDEKVKGTVHVALGDDTGFGGDVDCPMHLDGVVADASVEADGKPVEIS
ncbi:MAG: hypothetical protein MAG715_00863 [Methanonatronarchaeales archaeon]|nr:hypothetical protein [Methanonatronarchaeales archaeon]